MRELPIIFSTPMVRAILAGRKTQTRRVIKPQPMEKERVSIPDHGKGYFIDRPSGRMRVLSRAPYQVGDKLWCRETWCIGDGMNPYNDSTKPTFKADWPDVEHRRWRPSIFMPKKYARIWLEVTGVRAEMLQDISADDCGAEGLASWMPESNLRATFQRLWDSINGKKYPWDSNPWVFIYEFRRID